MHPRQRSRHQHEQQHETALPDAHHIIEHAEGQRQEEAAKAADHAHHTTHGAHVFGVVGRDVFEDRRLAQRHKEAQHHDQQHEGRQAHDQGKTQFTINALNAVFGGGIAEQESANQAGDEGPVHHAPRAVPVGEPATENAEQGAGQGEQKGDHAGGGETYPVDPHQVVGQPQRQGNEGAEHKKVIEREAPHSKVGHGRQPLAQGEGRSRVSRIPREHQEAKAHQRQHQRIHLGGALPAQRQQQ